MRTSLARNIAIMAAAAFTSLPGCQTANSDEWSSKGRSSSEGQPAATSGAPASTAMPPADGRVDGHAASVPVIAATGPIDPASLRAQSIALLTQAARSEWPLLRANAIESLSHAPSELDAAASRGLVDPNRGVRFVSVMTLTRAKRCDLSHLVEPLLADESPSVRASAITMLASCGRPVDQSPLASMILSDDPEVRGNAYVALGVIGNRSAVPMIRASVGRGMQMLDPMRVRVVDLQAAEALVKLGDQLEIEPIRAALFAPAEQAELTVLACQLVARLRDERSRPMLQRLIEASGDQLRAPEVRLAAADALGVLGNAESSVLVAIIEPSAMNPEQAIRAQAASALGASGSKATLGTLQGLLGDPAPAVRIAAAGAVLRLTKP